MLRKFKRYLSGSNESRHHDEDRPVTTDDDAESSDSMEDIDDIGYVESDVDRVTRMIAEVEGSLERDLSSRRDFEVAHVHETRAMLAKVKTKCEGCGRDFSEDLLNGETEVIRIRRRGNSRSPRSESSDVSSDGPMRLLSPEDLCVDCEIKQFPNRFHGCGFCRRPLRDLFACTTCRIGFAEWIKDVIPPETVILAKVRKQATRIISGIVESGFIQNREFLYQESQLMCRWPGFYAGPLNVRKNGKIHDAYLPTWIVPERIKIPDEFKSFVMTRDLARITKFEMFEKNLLQILEANDIHIFLGLTTFLIISLFDE